MLKPTESVIAMSYICRRQLWYAITDWQ